MKRDIERSEAERRSAEEALAVLNNRNKAIGDTIVGLENELAEKKTAASKLEDVA